MPDGTYQVRWQRQLDKDGLMQWRLSDLGKLAALEADAAVAEAAPIPALPDDLFT